MLKCDSVLGENTYYEVSTPFSDAIIFRRCGIDAICVGILPDEQLSRMNWPPTWGICHSETDTIEKCNAGGGGRVVVPKGIYLVGAIHLKSNVNLHVSKDATIRFSTDPKQYLPVVFARWEGVECMNYSALIYSFEQENIAVTGEGVLDGQGSDANWWRVECRESGSGWRRYALPTRAQQRCPRLNPPD